MTHITLLYDVAINMRISCMYQMTLLPSSDYNRCLLTTAVIIILSDTGCCDGLKFNARLWSATQHLTVTRINSILLCFGRNKLQGTASCAIHASRADQPESTTPGQDGRPVSCHRESVSVRPGVNPSALSHCERLHTGEPLSVCWIDGQGPSGFVHDQRIRRAEKGAEGWAILPLVRQ